MGYKLKQLLHRQKKLNLRMDIVEGGEVKDNHVVGWVKIRGQNDPQYIKQAREFIQDNLLDMDTDPKPTEEEVDEAHTFSMCATVACAITDWDEDFFDGPYSKEAATEIFIDKEYTSIYNQIAFAMQKSKDFLPRASQHRKSG